MPEPDSPRAGPSRRALLLAATAAAAASPGRAEAPGRLAPEVMLPEVELVGRVHALLHPGLLRYNTAVEMERRLAALRRECAQPLPLGGYYLALSRFTAAIRCGHSYPNFYNQTEAVQQALFEGRTRLPFLFRWLGDTMVVTTDPERLGLVRGSVVEAVNGAPAARILAALLPFVRTDGHNEDKQRRLLSVQGDDEYETFDIYYPLVFGAFARHRLHLREPDGRRRELVVEAIGRQGRLRQRPPTPDKASGQPLWRMERRGVSAVLTMPDWSVYDSPWDWRGWLNAKLDELTADRVPGLVIDLRANEGGLDCGDPILQRLVRKPIRKLAARRLVRQPRIPDDLRPVLRTWDRSFYDWGGRATHYDERFLELRDGDGGDQALTPSGPPYLGKVAVLVGPQNSSATFNFANLVQREKLGVLVGEPTGGNRRGIDGGAFMNLRLPTSKIEIDVPLIGVFPTTPQPDAGLLPTVSALLTARQIADGRDVAFEQALQAVRA